jgi:hypothetical protein
MSCLATAELSLDARCEDVVTPATRTAFPVSCSISIEVAGSGGEDEIAGGGTEGVASSITLEITDPYVDTGAVSIYLGMCISANCNGGGPSYYALENTLLSDLIGAGSDGMPLTLDESSTYSGIDPDTPIFLSCVFNGNDSYTFNIMTNTEATTEKELTLDLVSGDNRVDMKPLLEHIGGKVETTLVPTSDFEPVTIYSYSGPRPETFPAVAYPSNGLNFLFDFDAMESVPFALDGNSVVGIVPSSYSWYESPSFIFSFYLFSSIDADPLTLSNISGFDPSASFPYIFSYSTIQELLDAGGTLPLNVLTAGTPPEVVDDFPVQYYLHVELCEAQDGACYRFTVLTGAAETKTVLHLEPSCDTDIDLSPITDSMITEVSGEVLCNGAAHTLYDNTSSISISCFDSSDTYVGNGRNKNISGNKITFTVAPNTAYVRFDYTEPFTLGKIMRWQNSEGLLVEAGSYVCVDGVEGDTPK